MSVCGQLVTRPFAAITMCGAEMHLVQVSGDDTMMVRGYEHHTLECPACHENRAPAGVQSGGRIVEIGPDVDGVAYAAKDTKSGLVVMRNQDRGRLQARPAGAACSLPA